MKIDSIETNEDLDSNPGPRAPVLLATSKLILTILMIFYFGKHNKKSLMNLLLKGGNIKPSIT